MQGWEMIENIYIYSNTFCTIKFNQHITVTSERAG